MLFSQESRLEYISHDLSLISKYGDASMLLQISRVVPNFSACSTAKSRWLMGRNNGFFRNLQESGTDVSISSFKSLHSNKVPIHRSDFPISRCF